MRDSAAVPFIAPQDHVPEFTVRAVVIGALCGVLFGVSSVYLALKAGLTVAAAIPISVLAISLGQRFLKTTILENNLVQMAGSAGEAVASGMVFALPGLLFLSSGASGDSCGAPFMSFGSLFAMALIGGLLGTLLMIPLRQNLCVQEHNELPFPEGTAAASVLIAGAKGGSFARFAYWGVLVSFIYAFLQKVLGVIAGVPGYVTDYRNKYLPSATVDGEITPEYLGIGYVIGPKAGGLMVAGSVLAWLALIPLLATLVPLETVAQQLVKLGELPDLQTAGGPGGWDPAAQTFANVPLAFYKAYVRQIGAGAVACGGFFTLFRTLPVIFSSLKGSFGKTVTRQDNGPETKRTERDISLSSILAGCILLAAIICTLPLLPGDAFIHKFMAAVLVMGFGFFFTTVSCRIVGLIGSSSSPVSGMTIATLMGTCLVFIAFRWTGMVFEPLALAIGGMISLIVASAGVFIQGLKVGHLVGGTPRYMQIACIIGVISAAAASAWTMNALDKPTAALAAQGVTHAIGSTVFPAPQGTLMATLVRGLLAFNLDWQYVMVGVFLAVTSELCSIMTLPFAIGVYLPISTTLPIFIGGVVRWLFDQSRSEEEKKNYNADLGNGNLFATGLIAGGSLAGVVVALLMANERLGLLIESLSWQQSLEQMLGPGGYNMLGVSCFLLLALILLKVARLPEACSCAVSADANCAEKAEMPGDGQ
ncbi:MAG: OPT/YSL family transporter [bacterium]|nr:OPT/YSL family transporter [bacterium]